MFNCNVHIVPTSDHNMHMDNPEALARAIINDVYGLRFLLLPNKHLLKVNFNTDFDPDE